MVESYAIIVIPEKMDVTNEMMSPSTLNTTLAGKGKPEDCKLNWDSFCADVNLLIPAFLISEPKFSDKMQSTTEGGNSANIIKMTTYMAMVAFIACLMHVV